MPETPQYLLGRNRRRDAEKALRWLRGPDADLSAELEDMQKDVRIYILCKKMAERLKLAGIRQEYM